MQPLSVTELNQAIAAILTDAVGTVRVTGEISNFKRASSGHRYFTLKDEGGQVACTLWRGRPLNFLPGDGMQVIVTGDLAIYSPRGQYQLDCQHLTPLGQGELYLAFEALKRDLADRGYFDRDRKRPLPSLPLTIGVATSPTGAAIRDILSTLNRRFSACHINFVGTAVQGDRAPLEIARAITALDRQGSNELIIVGRGGGSLEDLWAFNTPAVAEAIYLAQTPIISGVGHETDYTIADFVADARAATPTAAAELATPYPQTDLLQQLDSLQQHFAHRVAVTLERHRDRLATLTRSYGFRSIGDRLHTAQQQLDEAKLQLDAAIHLGLTRKRQQLDTGALRLQTLNPLAPLQRGFALLRSNGQWLAPDRRLASGDRLEILRANQTARATIDEIANPEFKILE
ncbi:exodeoxyribonuclease VII large subunit [Synechococcus sp. PCC 7336]|uniref:exodeoxyribonuclease VII large subunit n=1 Tax=Synechococcus sp. PCC 7336 TaxID=195250 RepID=UPI0003449AA8|nr:exodeoxyribonuclease VII large subunit [Synechococcus sp. PCC 7336]